MVFTKLSIKPKVNLAGIIEITGVGGVGVVCQMQKKKDPLQLFSLAWHHN